MRVLGSGVRILVSDLDRAAAFYGSLGLHPTVSGDNWAILDDRAGAVVELQVHPGGDDPPYGLMVFVDALDESSPVPNAAVLEEGYRRRQLLRDPDGNVTHLVQNAIEPRSKANGTSAARRFLDHLGFRWQFVGDDAVLECDLREDLRGPGGALVGGVTATLVDTAAGTCATRVLGGRAYTSNMTIEYLAAGDVGPLRATCTVVRASERSAVVEVRVVDVGADESLIAIGLLQMRLRDKEAAAFSMPPTAEVMAPEAGTQ